MKSLYIHIGTGKTGTSALQAFLKKNQEALKINDFCYAQSGLIGDSHHRACFNFARNEPNRKAETLRILSQLKAEIEKGSLNNYIISSENFPGLTSEEIQLIKETLGDEISIKFIVYIRRQDQYVESWYSQVIKTGEDPGSIQNLYNLLKQEGFLSYLELVSKWERVFGQNSAIVRRYEKKHFHNGCIYSDFLNSIGLFLSPEFLMLNEHINPGLSREQILLGNALLKIDHEIPTSILRKPLPINFPRTSWLSFTERQEILSFCKADNDIIARTYFSSPELFADIQLNKDSEPRPIFENDYVLRFILYCEIHSPELLEKTKSALFYLLYSEARAVETFDHKKALTLYTWAKLLKKENADVIMEIDKLVNGECSYT